MASNSHFVVQSPHPIHLLGSTTVAPHPRHLEASVLSCSSVNISRKSLYVDAASPDFLPGLCLFALSYSSMSRLFLSSSMKCLKSLASVRLWPLCTNLWIDTQPSFPAAIASIANLGPVYTSPPTKISGSAVWYVTGSAFAVPFLLSSTFVPAKRFPQIICCPIERRTLSHSIVIVSFSSYTGANLFSALNTEVHFLRTTALTLPFSVIISFGPQPLLMLIFSSNASSIHTFFASFAYFL